MKYVLDFDRTLFDVERLYQALDCRGVRHLAGTAESFERVDMSDFVYTDVRTFLATKQKDDVFVLSSSSGLSADWEADYQTRKIHTSGVSALVSDVFVMSGMKGESLAGIALRFPPDEPIVFVDDRIEQCQSVLTILPHVHCILMVRDPAVTGVVTQIQNIPVAHSLAEVDAIIEKI